MSESWGVSPGRAGRLVRSFLPRCAATTRRIGNQLPFCLEATPLLSVEYVRLRPASLACFPDDGLHQLTLIGSESKAFGGYLIGPLCVRALLPCVLVTCERISLSILRV